MTFRVRKMKRKCCRGLPTQDFVVLAHEPSAAVRNAYHDADDLVILGGVTLLGGAYAFCRARACVSYARNSGLTMRDVESASLRIAERHGSEEFAIAPSRLSDIGRTGCAQGFIAHPVPKTEQGGVPHVHTANLDRVLKSETQYDALHVYQAHEEGFYVLEGELEFTVGSKKIRACGAVGTTHILGSDRPNPQQRLHHRLPCAAETAPTTVPYIVCHSLEIGSNTGDGRSPSRCECMLCGARSSRHTKKAGLFAAG